MMGETLCFSKKMRLPPGRPASRWARARAAASTDPEPRKIKDLAPVYPSLVAKSMVDLRIGRSIRGGNGGRVSARARHILMQ